jgi:hypothetical protein
VGDEFVLQPPKLVPLGPAEYREAVSLLARLLADAAARPQVAQPARPAGQLRRLTPNPHPKRRRKR